MDGLLTLFAGILGLLLLDAAALAFGANSREFGLGTEHDSMGEER